MPAPATTSDRADGGEVVNDLALGRPSGPVAPFIDRYVGYRMAGFPPGVHRGMPGAGLTFIISLADPVETLVEPGGRPGVATRRQAFVGGLSLAHALVAHDGNQHGIAVELTPLGSRRLFGLPAGELRDLVVDLGDVLGAEADGLVADLRELPDWRSRFAFLDRRLAAAAMLDGRPDVAPEVVHAWRLLVQDPLAPVAVEDIAAELGWSRRHLSTRMREETGLPPRQLRRLARFGRSRRLVAAAAARPADRRPTLADVAAASGYFDQAHLNREWRDLADCTPRTWLAEEELPPVLAEAADDLGGNR